MLPRSEADTGTSAGRELDDDTGAVFADSLLKSANLSGFEEVDLIVVPDVDVHQRRAGFVEACVDSTCSLT